MCLRPKFLLAFVLGLTGSRIVAAADRTGEQILREAFENDKRQDALRSQYAYHDHLELKRPVPIEIEAGVLVNRVISSDIVLLL